MSYILNSSHSNRNLNENPLITVTGDLTEFILSNLSTQITSDLGRESIDWHRSYDQPITVYLEANFVELDERKHFLNNYLKRSDGYSTTAKNKSHYPNLNGSNSIANNHSQHHHSANHANTNSQQQQQNVLPSAVQQSSSTAINVKRHNSFNVMRQFSLRGGGSTSNNHNNNSNNNNNNNTQDLQPATASGGSAGHHHHHSHHEAGQLGGDMSILDDPCQQVNTRLYRLIAKRYQLTNGARILLNSYWLDAGPDLESYSQSVRDSLFDWFGKILANAAYQCRIGFSNEFTLDCFIVIVIRDIYRGKQEPNNHHNHNNNNNSNNTSNHNNNNNSSQNSRHSNNHNNSEQVLSLEKLIEPPSPNKSGTFQVFKSNKFLRNSSSASLGPNNNNSLQQKSNKSHKHNNNNNSTSSLSNSLSSAISTGSHSNSSSSNSAHQQQISYSKLVEQIRNYLLVSFQLFQQECHQQQNTSGGGGSSGLTGPDFTTQLNAQQITNQLMERILIFDYTSNASQNNNNNTATSLASNFALSSTSGSVSSSSGSLLNSNTSTNPILSSTAKTFSALSSSIKIPSSSSSSSMSSPSKGGGFIGKHGKSGSGSGSGGGQPTIHNYSSFVTRLRSMLLEVYSRQFDSYEKLIRRQRELRNKPEWDFIGFFLLQEELSLAYENLGMYNKAMIQYDELDALFSQSILNTSTAGIGPQWLQRRLIGPTKDGLSSGGKYSSLYNAWNGLCLCNPEAINSLRYKIVECVLYDDHHCEESDVDEDGDEDGETTNGVGSGPHSYDPTEDMSDVEQQVSSSPALRNTTIGDNSSVFEFNDPLGVNHTVRPNRPTRSGHPRRSLSSSAQSNSLSSWINSSSEQISLIDFRNYLFARQCHLLCLLNKPWELASRALPFLQTCVYELNLLEISIAPGGIACWVFLSVLEILHKCERYSDSSQLESYSYHTVGLWSYARDKLAELGRLCNLMPGSIDSKLNSSEHLHRMVELVAGMGTDPHIRNTNTTDSELWLSPQERLKDALSSSESFLKHFFELTELTMGTYKHIGYIRSARLIGKELAELYLKLDKPQQALPFLLDLYNMFQTESWNFPKFEASRLLAQCLEQLYFSAYRRVELKDDTSSGDSGALTAAVAAAASPPTAVAFNLEATARSAFRTYLLLFLQCSAQSILQLSSSSSNKPTPPSAGQTTKLKNLKLKSSENGVKVDSIHEFYLESLRTLLKSYDKNGLKLGEIFEKLDSFTASPTIQTVCRISFDRPLLTIHNSLSDFFHNSPGSSASSSSNLNSSKTKLDISDECNLNSVGRGHAPYTNGIPCRDRGTTIFPLERFIRIQSAEISCENLLQKWNNNLVTNQLDGAASFIAGSMLRLKLVIFSELTIELEVKHLTVTLESDQNTAATSSGDRNLGNSSFTDLSASTTTTPIIKYNLSTTFENDLSSSSSSLISSNTIHCHPAAIIQTYNQNQLVGIRCTNIPQVLKRFDHLVNGGGGGGKFLPQIPVSLLNQRLSDDQNNFKNYRFFGSKYRFDLATPDVVKLKPGRNEYTLFFQTPEQLNNFQSSNNNNSSTTINEIRFHFDQLVFLCSVPVSLSENNDNLSFALVEDFCQTNGEFGEQQQQSSSLLSFSLVKCPPKVELIPLELEEISDDNNNNNNNNNAVLSDLDEKTNGDNQTGKKKKTFPNLLIGIDRSVCLRLNAGTNLLPRGLKCFVKISPIIATQNQPNHPNSIPIDYRSVNVSLHPDNDDDDADKDKTHSSTTVASSTTDDDDSLLYFYLDRQIEPFESFELRLKLKSNYSRMQFCTIKKFTSASGGGGGGAFSRNNLQSSFGQSRDFTLTISWSHLDSNSYTVNSSCCFSLYEPFQVVARLHTSLDRKFVQIGLRGAEQIPPDRPIHLNCPRLSHSSSEIDSGTTTTIVLKPLSFKEANGTGNDYPFKLLPTRELYFVWQIITTSGDCSAPNINLKRITLELNYCSDIARNRLQQQQEQQMGYSQICDDVENAKTIRKLCSIPTTTNKVQYDIRISFDYNTRYVIREQIEPMPGMKNSELLRIGNSCLLRASIERYFPTIANEDGSSSGEIENEMKYDDEYVMYELVCDPELWTMVSSYRSLGTYDYQESSSNSINSESGGAGGGGGGSSGSLIGNELHLPTHHHHSSMSSIVSSSTCCDNIVSKVIKLTRNDSTFESTFEVMPLTPGYIPLPTIRLSRYIPSSTTQSHSSTLSLNDPTSGGSNKQQQPPLSTDGDNSHADQQNQSNNSSSAATTQPQSLSSSSGPLSNTIESLSAKLSENLSLTSKNWSKFINHLPSSSGSSSNSNSNQSRIQNESSIGSSSTTSATATTNQNNNNASGGFLPKTSKLVAFEPGQVYNYNRASQIYVLPSTGPVIADL